MKLGCREYEHFCSREVLFFAARMYFVRSLEVYISSWILLLRLSSDSEVYFDIRRESRHERRSKQKQVTRRV